MALGKFDNVDAANIGSIANLASVSIGKVGGNEISSPAVFATPTGGTLTVCGGANPGNTIDGNLSNYWGSANESPVAFWQYDYGVGVSKLFTGYRIRQAWGDNSWMNYVAKISSNGINWTTLSTDVGGTANADVERSFACSTPGRYVRIESDVPGAGVQWAEVEIRME